MALLVSGGSAKVERLPKAETIPHLTPRQLADGTWFHLIMARAAKRVVDKQRKRKSLDHWRTRFPDHDELALCDEIVRSASRKAAVIGGLAGASISGIEVAAIVTLGMPIGLGFAIALIELAILEKQQVKMIFTLADVHQHELKTEHLGDLGSLYGHVLKAKGASRAASYSRQGAVMLFRVLATRFVQRAAVKFCLPVLSVIMGGGMNFWLTRSLGRHSVHRFRRDRRCAEHLKRTTVDQADAQLLLSLLMMMASGDGRVSRKERAFLRKTLEELCPDPSSRPELVAGIDQPVETLLDAFEARADEGFQALALELCSLMAVIDGTLDPDEMHLLDRMMRRIGQRFDEAVFREIYGEFLNDSRRYRRRLLKQQAAIAETQRALSE